MALVAVTCILRPYLTGPNAGIWYIQNDNDHQSSGVNGMSRSVTDMHVHFSGNFSHVGSAIAVADDGFAENGIYFAVGGVGLGSARITMWKDNIVTKVVNGVSKLVLEPEQLCPGAIPTYMKNPADGNGNLWFQALMHTA